MWKKFMIIRSNQEVCFRHEMYNILLRDKVGA